MLEVSSWSRQLALLMMLSSSFRFIWEPVIVRCSPVFTGGGTADAIAAPFAAPWRGRILEGSCKDNKDMLATVTVRETQDASRSLSITPNLM